MNNHININQTAFGMTFLVFSRVRGNPRLQNVTHRTRSSRHNRFRGRTNARYDFTAALHHVLTNKHGFIAVIVSNSQRVISESPGNIFVKGWWNQNFILFHR